MDFTFSEDQIAFRDAVSRFLMAEAAPETLREIWATDSGRSSELWQKIVEQGITSVSVPESEGGLGLSDIDWSLLTQEFGYYGLGDPLTDTACLATGILTALPDGHTLRAEWLPRVVDGSCRIAVGHPVNPWVADAELADLLLLPEATPAGPVLHAVPCAAVQLTAQPSIDASRRLAGVQWQPSDATRVADAPASLWEETLERGALVASGQLVGLAQRMLDLAVDYAMQRKQFGKPIGSFQAIKHHLADVLTQIEFARPVLYRAAAALANREPGCAVRVSHAKLACAKAAWVAARKGIQVHGAMGYTWEVDLQMFMKRAWVLSAAWGDRTFHRARLAAALLDAEAPSIGPGVTFGLAGNGDSAHG